MQKYVLLVLLFMFVSTDLENSSHVSCHLLFQLFDILWDDNLTQPMPSFAKMSGLSDDYNFLRTQVLKMLW